ncbi:SMP-30/gluconolactonase/LRE family protein [Rhodococcus gannanensis]|uniref:SMP-30/gluconolactonase/LRE family protein n=1 Tax=Rhodococcus gannanensis TaxID=1960308 RepID=A0ABW4P9S6_9NOCA
MVTVPAAGRLTAATVTALVLGIGSASAFPLSATTPMCSDVGAPRSVAQPSAYEAVAFDSDGRMLVSNAFGNSVDMVDTPGAPPRSVATVPSPGGIAPLPDGTVLVGSGNSTTAFLAPTAELRQLNPTTGEQRVVANGLSMANGVVRASDGTVYASSDVEPAIDRVHPDGRVERAWYRASTANGLALSADERTLFANVSIGDTSIVAIDTETGASRVHFRPPPALALAFLDDLDIDGAGRLYTNAFLAGQTWRVDPDGSFCAVATNLVFPAGISVGAAGSPFAADSVYVTTYSGSVYEIPRAVPRP